MLITVVMVSGISLVKQSVHLVIGISDRKYRNPIVHGMSLGDEIFGRIKWLIEQSTELSFIMRSEAMKREKPSPFQWRSWLE